MSMLVNSVQLIGRLGADVEIKTTNQGTKVANGRLATNEYTKNGQSEWVETTYWHNVVFWGKLAEKLEKSNKKGTRLLIQGAITYREYTDIHNVKREVMDIRVNQFMTLTSNQGSDIANTTHPEEMDDLP